MSSHLAAGTRNVIVAEAYWSLPERFDPATFPPTAATADCAAEIALSMSWTWRSSWPVLMITLPEVAAWSVMALPLLSVTVDSLEPLPVSGAGWAGPEVAAGAGTSISPAALLFE